MQALALVSPRESVTVVSIGGNDVIVVAHSRDGADHNGLLTDIEVAEAADLLRLILLARAFLETTNQQHQREHLDFVALLGPLH